MKSILLNGDDWLLTCYWQHQWRRRDPNEQSDLPALPPIPARVPGAVHADLLKARYIPDWQNGLDSFKSEWVEHRDWSFQKQIRVPDDYTGQILLECDGLDYSGTLLVDREEVGTFEGTHFRHRFDLTGKLQPGQSHTLELIFNIVPADVEGVFGFTSRHRTFKPRFGYYWDWCKRIVNVGIWQDVRLVNYGQARFAQCRVNPRVNDDLTSGTVRVVTRIEGASQAIRYKLIDEADADADTDVDASVVAHGEHPFPIEPETDTEGETDFTIALDAVKLWWPATHGDQPLYRLELELIDAQGNVSHRLERVIGFKRVRWLDNPNAPENAKPYLCEVNGQTLFLRGINWTPISPLYGTVTRERYAMFLELYRHMHCNILRVWGGAMLETPAFYELCDRMGLMVWQEFPLSSSGVDNWPPEAVEAIAALKCIASEYIERRCHHASHLLWCGGNELQGAVDGGKVGIGKPVDESHPLMREWEALVNEMDPGKRFQATSPSGPRFFASPDDFGKGIHHQTHGPWGNLELKGRYDYYNRDDSLFRSETGSPGAASMDALIRHRGDQPLGPADKKNPYWLVPGAAWIPDEDVAREFGPIPNDMQQLSTVVKCSRYLQAESYRYAAEATRRKHPHCTGFIVWMGHDCVHCAANNSIIEIDGSTKPAYDWLRLAYAPRSVTFKHDRITYKPQDRLTGEVWVARDEGDSEATGSVQIEMQRLNGEVTESMTVNVQGDAPSFRVATLDWLVRDCDDALFILSLTWQSEGDIVRNTYLLSQHGEHPLWPMVQLAPTLLEVESAAEDMVRIKNSGDLAAVGVRLVNNAIDQSLCVEGNHTVVMPGETCEIRYKRVNTCHSGDAQLGLEWFNSPAGLKVRLPAS